MGTCIQGQFRQTIIHQELGELQKTYFGSDNFLYYKISNSVSSVQQYKRWSNQNKKMKLNKEVRDYLYLPSKELIHDGGGLFTQQPAAEILYESYAETLGQFIDRLNRQKLKPSEQLLWYLMFVLVKVGKFFEKLQKKIGNIKPANILITQKAQIKVVWSKTTMMAMDPIDQVMHGIKNNNLLAPEELGFIDKTSQRLCSALNPQYSEVFTCGMMILALATGLVDVHLLYSYSPFQLVCSQLQDKGPVSKINFKKIDKLLEKCSNQFGYSDLLIKTLKEMLQRDPSKRIKSSDLFKRLSIYQTEILSKKGLSEYFGPDSRVASRNLQRPSMTNRSSKSNLVSQSRIKHQQQQQQNGTNNSIYNNSYFTANHNQSLAANNTRNLSMKVSDMSESHLNGSSTGQEDQFMIESNVELAFGGANREQGRDRVSWIEGGVESMDSASQKKEEQQQLASVLSKTQSCNGYKKSKKPKYSMSSHCQVKDQFVNIL